MDIARPDIARKKRKRRILFGAIGVLAIGSITFALSRLEQAVPRVDKAILLFDNVKRGSFLRDVHGNGTLVPEQIQFVQSDTDGRVERIFMQAGAEVEPESVILELSNPELKQAAFDAEWLLKGSEATLERLKVQVESDRLAQESALATLRANAKQAELEAEADEILVKDGLVAAIAQKKSRANADDLNGRVEIERKRLAILVESSKAQLAVQEAEVQKNRAQLALKQKQVAGLLVRAGIAGVLQQIGDLVPLQAGQRVAPSATLAKVVVPTKLKAEIKVAETQAKDVTRGQRVEIDTRNGKVPGHVVRVDPAVQNATVLVEVKLDGPLPKGSRPDLSVDGTIELERLTDVLYVGRPYQSQADSTLGLFKVIEGGRYAVRLPIKLGRTSVSSVEVVEGLQAGDQIILSDMSQWDSYQKVRID